MNVLSEREIERVCVTVLTKGDRERLCVWFTHGAVRDVGGGLGVEGRRREEDLCWVQRRCRALLTSEITTHHTSHTPHITGR